MQKLHTPGASLELGYWAIRGLGQPIRCLLAYLGVPFSETRYGINQDGTLVDDESADWTDHRPHLNLAFANLPYLIVTDGEESLRITQSNAIMRYLARQHDMYGDSDTERVLIDVLQDELYDYRNSIIRATYVIKYDYANSLANFTANALPRYLDAFEQHLAARGVSSHFVGQRLSYVDFIAYELIWQTSLMVDGSVAPDSRAHLHQFMTQFAALAPIAAYMKSPNYIDRPINSEGAAFK